MVCAEYVVIHIDSKEHSINFVRKPRIHGHQFVSAKIDPFNSPSKQLESEQCNSQVMGIHLPMHLQNDL